jgi:hypothetical protein
MPATIRPGRFWMYATVPSVVTLSLAGGIHWTVPWADLWASRAGGDGLGGLNRKARGVGNRLYSPLEGSDDVCWRSYQGDVVVDAERREIWKALNQS